MNSENDFNLISLNQLVRFKLHGVEEPKEGIVRALDEHGYWIEGGSLAEYLRSAAPGGDPTSEFQFLELKRIHGILIPRKESSQ